MQVIPKIIHYCWFGGKEKPAKIQNYIRTWKKYAPEYRIVEWNERNFPINNYKYAKEAYQKQKFAFVSDVARLYALYTVGGIYFDTDIQLLRPLPDFQNAEVILSFETDRTVMTGFMAGIKNHKIWKDLLEEYRTREFVKDNKTINNIPNTTYVTNYLLSMGLTLNNKEQILQKVIKVFPRNKFGAFNPDTNVYEINPETILVHQCLGSWHKPYVRFWMTTKKMIARHSKRLFPLARKIKLLIKRKFK